MINIRQFNVKKLNIALIFAVLMLTSAGLAIVKIVVPAMFAKQVLGVILGIAVCIVLALVDYHMICGFALFLYAFGIVLLLLVQVPGIGVSYWDARRWINLGPLGTLQPSELVKVIVIIALAQYLTLTREIINRWKVIALYFAILIFPMLLVFIQPDLSSCLVFAFFSLLMLYFAGISYKIVVPFLIISVPATVALVWYVCQPFQAILKEYQQGRILGLFYPDKYPKIMFQQNKSIAMLANGKLYGVINEGSIDDLTCPRMPIVECDFIFTAIGEAFGFIGTLVILSLQLFLIMKCLSTARRAKDYTGKLVCIGVSAMFMFQVFANVGVVSRFLPNTGLPLPFVSCGISSMLSYFAAIGLVINVGLQGKNTARG